VSSASPDVKRFRFSILIASSRYGSTITKFTAPCIVPATNPEISTIGEKEQGCSMILGVKDQYPKANQSVIQKAEYEKKKFNCEKKS